MSYTTQRDVEIAAGGAHRLIELTALDKGQVIDLGVLAHHQAQADGTINSYLRALYATPLASPTPEIVTMAAALTVYYLRVMRGTVRTDDEDQQKIRLSWLEGVRDGKIRIAEPAPSKSSAVRSAIVTLGGDVTRESLKGMW